MKKLLIITLLSILSIFQLVAQVPIQMGAEVDNLFLRTIEARAMDENDDAPAGVEGSIFLHDKFENGEVITKDAHYENLKVRYNILNDEFYFRMGPQVMVLDPSKKDLKMVKVGNEVFVAKVYEYKMRKAFGFLEQLVAGNYGLFAKKNITLRPAKPPQALSTEPTPARYIRKSDTYYLSMPDGTLKMIKNGKDLAAMFKNTKFQAEAKDQKISLKKDEHLPALVQLLNDMKL